MRSLKPVLVTAILLFVMINPLSAQSKKKFSLTLKKIEIRNDLQTPTFADRIDDKKNIPLKKWAVIMAEYEVKFARIQMPKGSLDDGKWIDSMEVNWEFLYKPKEAKNNIQNYIKFQRTVKYTNIGEGRHTVMLFINPVILKRYFNEGRSIKTDLYIRYSMKANGHKEVMKVGSLDSSVAMFLSGRPASKKDYAGYTSIFNSDRSKPLGNVLLRRDETPFRSMQYDMFDSIAVEDVK